MPRFRKKPVEVEAVQWTGENVDEVREFMGPSSIAPIARTIRMTTIHGEVASARIHDWIIAESKPGRFYPCKPDIFAASYVSAESGPEIHEPDDGNQAWRGQPPAEGTRRWQILEAIKTWLIANPGKPVTSEEEAIDFADEVESALLSAAAQPEQP
jgi:hypothetical protein